jgi:hypothetical protein
MITQRVADVCYCVTGVSGLLATVRLRQKYFTAIAERLYGYRKNRTARSDE